MKRTHLAVNSRRKFLQILGASFFYVQNQPWKRTHKHFVEFETVMQVEDYEILSTANYLEQVILTLQCHMQKFPSRKIFRFPASKSDSATGVEFLKSQPTTIFTIENDYGADVWEFLPGYGDAHGMVFVYLYHTCEYICIYVYICISLYLYLYLYLFL